MSIQNSYQLIVVGGGPAGLAAACAAKEGGLESVLILEREPVLGGILHQCIHTGFGLKYFKEELTGPEYTHRFLSKVKKMGIEYKTSAMVLSVNEDKTVVAASETEGLMILKAEAVVLAMGCRERTRGALNIAGTRPAGVFTAGSVQKMVNIGGLHVGEKAVILGSGDIGMILARRLKLEGKEVAAVVEILPHVGGLLRNKVQCLDDFGIPLLTSHTVTEVLGKYRVEGVVVCPVDADSNPIYSEQKTIECDALITSVGLIPETELGRDLGLDFNKDLFAVNEKLQTNLPWVFACGNVLFVHDLVDDVTLQAITAGQSAAHYVLENGSDDLALAQTQQKRGLVGRPKADEMVCTLCPTGCIMKITITPNDITVENNACEQGRDYAINELHIPKRHLTTTIAIGGDPSKRLPVRTSKPVPKDKIPQVMKEIQTISINTPVTLHQILIYSVADSDSNIISSAELRG